MYEGSALHKSALQLYVNRGDVTSLDTYYI